MVGARGEGYTSRVKESSRLFVRPSLFWDCYQKPKLVVFKRTDNAGLQRSLSGASPISEYDGVTQAGWRKKRSKNEPETSLSATSDLLRSNCKLCKCNRALKRSSTNHLSQSKKIPIGSKIAISAFSNTDLKL